MKEKPLEMLESMPPIVREAIKKMRDNLLIVLVKRAGGELRVPVEEIDAADDLMTMTIDGNVFVIKTERRQ